MDPPELQSVKEFMMNNEKLPEDVMEDLKRGLAKPRQELADLDAQIKELQDRLTQLEVKRDRVEKYIAQYECVLAPIRRLPADILHDIFHNCLPTRRDAIMSAKEAPLLLTQVCSAWRQTAQASPLLWARLYITFSDEDLLQDVEITDGSTQQCVSDTLQLRCIAVEEWLSRSGACPLSISLCYTSRIWASNDDISPGNSEHTRTLFRILARHLPRWHRLELRMPIEVYQILETMVPVAQLHMLNSIRTSCSRQIESVSGPQEEHAIGFWAARNLKKMSLNTNNSPVTAILSTANLVKLSSLSISSMIYVTEAISLLMNCPNLEYTTLTLTSEHPQVHANQGFMIFLPHLRALSITDCAHPDFAHRLYDHMDAPQLEWFDYTKESGYFGVNLDQDQTAIIPFLQRLTTLKKLTITGFDLSTVFLRRILSNTQSISHLVFGPETRTNENFLAPSAPYGMSPYPAWDLGDLFLQESGEDVGYDPAATLVPRLEILEISQAASGSITDEVLRDIIFHRSNPISPNDVARLKKVAVLFSRAKKFDISKELFYHSENAAKVELRLEYLNENLGQGGLHLVCSGYGMNDLGRSWQFRDIEEEMMFS